MEKVNSQGNYNSEAHVTDVTIYYSSVPILKDMDSGEIVVSSIRSGMKREFALMMKAQSEMGGLTAGRRRVTRSQSTGSSSKGVGGDVKISNKKAKGSNSKKTEKDAEETLGREAVGKSELIDISDGEKGTQVDVIELGSNVSDDCRNLEPELVAAVDRIEVEKEDEEEGEKEKGKVGSDFKECTMQPLVMQSPLPQVECNDRDLIHEDDRTVGGSSDLGCDRTREATSSLTEKPLRRITRSALKLQDEEMELGSSAGVVETGSSVTLTTSPSKLELKMSKKVELKRVPRKLKDLLETGLLEGLHVQYIQGSKGRRRPETELQGTIQGTGILCSCDECNGRKVVTPNQFELHAHSGNKRPPEYIYLDNGKSLRDVLNACKVDLSNSLEFVIQNAIGRSVYITAFCLSCKGLIPETGAGRSMLLCNSCFQPESDPSHTQKESDPSHTQKEFDPSHIQKESDPSHTQKESDPSHTQISDTPHRSPLVDSPAPDTSRCQPEVQESVQISSSTQPRMKRQGRLTRKDLRMHKSVFAEDVLPDGTALSYVMHGEKKLEGYKKDGAIFCSHCNEVVSPSQFEAHAGFASRRKPYMSIYTSNGVSLHQLSLELSKNRKSSTAENDDLCSICEDGGDLLCCENCPRAFHNECVGLPRIPLGTWYCKYCLNMFEKEKFAERNANAIAAGRVPGVDPLAEITQRCIRIVETFEIGGCAICRGHDFSKSEFNGRTVIICDQCEKEYHVGCLKEQNIDDLQALPEDEWFCNEQCSSINSALQKLMGDGELRLPEAVSDILKNKRNGQGSEQNPEIDIRWRLLSGKKASEDTRVWLSGAVSIFHDRFDPIADASTSRLDLIPHMVYGRHFKDQDFCGMYCAILLVDSVVVSAGLFRVFGEEVAELPLVATKTDCQGKGYFQSLFFCIEDILTSLNVKDLVLPAADEAESLWKNKFGFEKLDEEELDRYKKSYQMMIFQGTSVLHKRITKS